MTEQRLGFVSPGAGPLQLEYLGMVASEMPIFLGITTKTGTSQTIHLTFSSLMYISFFDKIEMYDHSWGKKKCKKSNFCILSSSK